MKSLDVSIGIPFCFGLFFKEKQKPGEMQGGKQKQFSQVSDLRLFGSFFVFELS